MSADGGGARRTGNPPATRAPREMDIGMIRRLLPHRYPMLLVDRVLDWEPGKFLRAIKNVTANEPFFQGHFPAYPVMPGVLVIEAMAQVAGLLTMLSDVARRDGSQLVLFAGIDEARFKRQVVPGDTLALEASLERAVRGIGRFHTRATVGSNLVCEATLLAAIRDVPPVPDLPV
jgi:3-hydroxyacyl-[acyl-carrier-protein] dehydratase